LDVDALVVETVAAVQALPVTSAAPMRAVRVALSRMLRRAAPADLIAAALGLKDHGLDWMGWELVYRTKRRSGRWISRPSRRWGGTWGRGSRPMRSG